MKVVLDTNVLVSGIFFSGPPAGILRAWTFWADERMKMMKTIAICVALVAGPALATDAPSFVVVGAACESRTLGVADLQKLTVREVSVTDPHSKQPSRYRGVALSAVLSLVGVPSEVGASGGEDQGRPAFCALKRWVVDGRRTIG